MKKVLITLVLFGICGLLFAHAPAEVLLSFDAETNMLSVAITHLIKATKATDPAVHRIKDIVLTVNGNKLITETIAVQQSDDGEKAVYLLNVKKGDKISVMANCSLAGSKTTDLVIE